MCACALVCRDVMMVLVLLVVVGQVGNHAGVVGVTTSVPVEVPFSFFGETALYDNKL